jgi:hypothetical protein
VSTRIAQWQTLLDADFPQGAVCAWDSPDSAVYQVPRIGVTGSEGSDPVVVLPVFGVEKVIGPDRLLSYTLVQRSPVLVARATLSGAAAAMLWSAGVGPELARQMSQEREELVRLAPRGGTAILTGEREEV